MKKKRIFELSIKIHDKQIYYHKFKNIYLQGKPEIYHISYLDNKWDQCAKKNCLSINGYVQFSTLPLVSLYLEYGWHIEISCACMLSIVRGCPMAGTQKTSFAFMPHMDSLVACIISKICKHKPKISDSTPLNKLYFDSWICIQEYLKYSAYKVQIMSHGIHVQGASYLMKAI